MKSRMISLVGCLVAVAVFIGGMYVIDRIDQAEKRKLIVAEYPMCNQNIEWTGAGYNGFWGKE